MSKLQPFGTNIRLEKVYYAPMRHDKMLDHLSKEKYGVFLVRRTIFQKMSQDMLVI